MSLYHWGEQPYRFIGLGADQPEWFCQITIIRNEDSAVKMVKPGIIQEMNSQVDFFFSFIDC